LQKKQIKAVFFSEIIAFKPVEHCQSDITCKNYHRNAKKTRELKKKITLCNDDLEG
jgi:hypothetical protein